MAKRNLTIWLMILLVFICLRVNPAVALLIYGDFTMQDGDDYYPTKENVTIHDSTGQTSIVTIMGGRAYALLLLDSVIANMSGGAITYISPRGTSTLNFTGGSSYNIKPYYSGTVNMIGGSVTYLSAFDSSTMNIMGGSIGNLSAYHSSIINVFGTDFLVNQSGLTGKWADGTPFSISFFDHPGHITPGDSTYQHVNLLPPVIPEPATLLLLGLGAVMLRRKGGA